MTASKIPRPDGVETDEKKEEGEQDLRLKRKESAVEKFPERS